MVFPTVAFDLTDAFTIVVVESTTVEAGEVTVFAFDDNTGTQSAVMVGRAFAGGGGEVADFSDHGHGFAVVVDDVGVGGFARVVPIEAPPDADDTFGEMLDPGGPSCEVGVVRAVVTQFTVAGVPDPVPVVLEFATLDGDVFGRSEPEVVINRGRDFETIGLVPDGITQGVVNNADVFDFAQFALAELFEGCFEGGVGAALRTGLDDAVVFFRGEHHALAFIEVVGDGFFDVDILTGLAGPDGGECVPVITRRDDDRIDGFVFDEFAEIGVGGGGLFESFDAGVEPGLVGVAHGRNADTLEAVENVDMLITFPPEPDDADADVVIRAADLAGKHERAGGSEDAGIELSACKWHGSSPVKS